MLEKDIKIKPIHETPLSDTLCGNCKKVFIRSGHCTIPIDSKYCPWCGQPIDW